MVTYFTFGSAGFSAEGRISLWLNAHLESLARLATILSEVLLAVSISFIKYNTGDPISLLFLYKSFDRMNRIYKMGSWHLRQLNSVSFC